MILARSIIAACLLVWLGSMSCARADWMNLTGAETAPNIAEITILDGKVRIALEIYIGNLDFFETLLPDSLQAPIIVTFRTPADPSYDFAAFYDALRRHGYVIYPGKLTVADSFRIGCICRVFEDDIQGVLATIEETLAEMGVRNCAPARAA